MAQGEDLTLETLDMTLCKPHTFPSSTSAHLPTLLPMPPRMSPFSWRKDSRPMTSDKYFPTARACARRRCTPQTAQHGRPIWPRDTVCGEAVAIYSCLDTRFTDQIKMPVPLHTLVGADTNAHSDLAGGPNKQWDAGVSLANCFYDAENSDNMGPTLQNPFGKS